MEIKVGEYVRTHNGLIGQIVRITDVGNYAIRIYNGAEYVVRAVITKHSKNIIDLIEVGDIVNGLEVYKGRVASGKEKLLVGNHIIKGMALEAVNIKTILTHEQYEANCYKVEEEV